MAELSPITSRCPLCGTASANAFWQRSSVPVHQHLLIDSAAAARSVTRGDLAITCCDTCGFVFNARFDPALLSYGERYDNVQTHSPLFADHTAALRRRMVEAGVRHCRIVEVGCGKGQFITALLETPGNEDSLGYGFDPSYEGPERTLNGRLTFERRFYDRDAAAIRPDAVICRHVIEHVPDPLALLRTVRTGLGQAPNARVFFETPCVRWILEQSVFWDFFYEHCSYFTAESLTFAFERAGFAVDSVLHVFGGQYLWLEATPAAAAQGSAPVAGDLAALSGRFERCANAWIADIRERVRLLAADGPIAVWGAGAKGVTFVNQIDPTRELINCLVDLNPNKWGRFVPGTGHPIHGVHDVSRLGITRALLTNINYFDEIAALLRTEHLSIELLDLMDLSPLSRS